MSTISIAWSSIAGRKRSASCSNRQICIFPVICCSIAIMAELTREASADNRSLIYPRTFQVIGSKTYDSRTPVVTIQTHVHAPFLHGLVVDNIRSPLHTGYVIGCVSPGTIHIDRSLILPSMGIEVAESHFLALIVLHLFDDVSGVSIFKINQFAIHVSKKTVTGSGILLTRFEGVPYLIVARSISLGSAQMRTVDIIFRVGGRARNIHHDRRVMHRDAPCYRLGSVCISQIIIADSRLSHSSVHRHQTHDRK